MQDKQRSKKILLLVVGLPLAVVVPLLIASFLIGPQSIYLWAGIGLGMLIVTFYYIPKWRKEKELAKRVNDA